MRLTRHAVIPPVLLALLFLAGAGCSPKARLERHVTAAQGHVESGRYDAAEAEFIHVLRVEARHARAHAGLGRIYFEQGSLTKAAPRLLAARELAPDDLDNRTRLARTLLTLGRAADARAEALHVLGHRAGDPEALQVLAEASLAPEQVAEARARLTADDAPTLVALAMLDLRERRLDEAVARVGRALQHDPRFAPAHSLMANLHLARQEHDAALASLRTAAELSPARSPRRLGAARLLLARGDTEAGRAAIEAVLAGAPDFIPASLMLADILAARGEHGEAQATLDSVFARDPENPEAGVMRARIHLSRGENTAAIEVLDRLVARYPDSAPMHQLLATAHFAANDSARALASATRTLQLAPDQPEALMLRSAIQLRSGDAASAVLGLRELVRKNPGLHRARILLADALRLRGQADEALEVYRAGIELAPADPQLRLLAGALLAQVGRADEARRVLSEALSIRPDFTPAIEQLVALDLAARDIAAADTRARAFAADHHDIAEAHVLVAKVAVAAGESARAEESLRRAIEIAPDSPTAYLLLAQLYLEERRQEEALVRLEEASARNPRDIAALMLIGIIRQQKGEIEPARRAYERLLEANPRFVPALNNLAYLYSENLRDLDKAFELANRARELRPHDPVSMDTFGWILFQRREFTWASSVLAESASKLPGHPEVQYHFGMSRYMLGDEAGARAALHTALAASSTFPGHDTARAHLAILDIDPTQAGRETITTLKQHLDITRDDPVAWTRLAGIHARLGERDEARAAFEESIRLTPNNATALALFARFLAAQPDDAARAGELARNAYRIAPENPLVLHVLGRIAYDGGDHVWAAGLLRDAARRRPDDAALLRDLADAVYAVGQVDEAIPVWRASLAGAPDAPDAGPTRRALALAEAARGTPLGADAVSLLREASDPSPQALMLDGLLHESRGDAAGALTRYERVIARLPRFTPAHKRLALLAAADDPPGPRAHEIAGRARELLPGDAEVAGAFGTILHHRGEFRRAAALLGEAARAPSATPTIHYLHGVALHRSDERERARAALQRALDLGLDEPAAAEARRLLSAAP